MKFKIKTDDDEEPDVVVGIKLVVSEYDDDQIELVGYDADGTDYQIGYFDKDGLHLWVENDLPGLPVDRNGYLKIDRIK